MHRLLIFLFMLTFCVTNGGAVAAALCEHVDAEAHAAALLGADRSLAAEAQHEDAAAATADKKAASADAASAQLAGFLQPAEPAIHLPTASKVMLRPADAVRLSHRETRPLLTPPLA